MCHVDGFCMCQPGWKGKDCEQGKVKVCQEPEKCVMWMVLVCVSLDGRVKIINKVKLKSVRNQRSVIMWMVLVCVSLDGRVKIVNKVKLKSVRNQRSVSCGWFLYVSAWMEG